MDRPIAPAHSYPLGATLREGGVNFSVFSKHGTGVELRLFNHVDEVRPARVLGLDRRMHRTYHYSHVFVPAIAPGQLYAFHVQGLFDPANGLRFDASKALLDRYGKWIARAAAWSRQAARRPGDHAATAFKSAVVDPTAREDHAPPRHPFDRTVIHEMYLGRFTRDASSGDAVLGYLRARDPRIPGFGSAVPHHSPRCDRNRLQPLTGSAMLQRRQGHRHAYVRRFGAAQSLAAGIRVHGRECHGDSQVAAAREGRIT